MSMRCLAEQILQRRLASRTGHPPVVGGQPTWLDVLTWSRPDGVDEPTAKAPNLPIVAEMHSLIGEVLAVDTGEIAHSTMP